MIKSFFFDISYLDKSGRHSVHKIITFHSWQSESNDTKNILVKADSKHQIKTNSTLYQEKNHSSA